MIDLSKYPRACPVKHDVVERRGTFPVSIPFPTEPWIGHMPWWDYHMLRAVRSSDLRTAEAYSLAHMRHERDNEDDDAASQVMTRGRALHALLLEPDTEWKKYARAPDWLVNRSRKKDKEEWDRLVMEHGVDFVMRAEEYDGVVEQGKRIKSKPTYAALLRKGEREMTVVWRDEDTGVWCKARLDFLTVIMDRITVLDIKGTKDARPDAFSRSVGEYGYHFQGAHYLEGLTAHGIAATDYCLLASEWAAPYECRVFRLSDHALTLAMGKREQIMRRIKEAEDTGRWEGYPEDVAVVSPPGWVMKSMEAELQMREVRS